MKIVTFVIVLVFAGTAGGGRAKALVPAAMAIADRSTATLNSSASADLALFGSARPVVAVGGTLDFTFQIFNTFGPDTAQGVTFTDTLPSGVDLVSATSREVQPQNQPQGSCSGTATITCSLGLIPRYTSVQITIEVTPTVLGNVTDVGTLTAATSDPNSSDDQAMPHATVVPAGTADVGVNAYASPDPSAIGNSLTETVWAFNYGPAESDGMTVTEAIPTSFTVSSITVTQGSCSGTHTITCSLGSLPIDATATVTIYATPTVPGSFIEQSSVTASTTDPIPDDNRRTRTMRVSPWSVDPTSGTPANIFTNLAGVAGLSSSDVWAVGTSCCDSSYNNTALAEHWDGMRWSVLPTPSGGGGGYLNGVAEISSKDVWAVGDSGTGSVTETEHWNGTKWSIVKSPSPDSYSSANALYSASAIASNDVWAVGTSGAFGGNTLAEHWNGSSWKAVATPSPEPQHNYLWGVTALSHTNAWAVGSAGANTLIEHWDGSKWSVVPSANGPDPDWNVLTSVSAVSPTDIWAVGYSCCRQEIFLDGLIEHWQGPATKRPGGHWMVVPSPSDGNVLFGVVALSSNDAWAVGGWGDLQGGLYGTVAEHWDGSTWSVVPTSGGTWGFLAGVAARRFVTTRPPASVTTDAWGVGGDIIKGVLIESLHTTSNGNRPPLRALSGELRATATKPRTCSGQVMALPASGGSRALVRLTFSFSCNEPVTKAQRGVLRLTIAGAPPFLGSAPVAHSPKGSWSCQNTAQGQLVCTYGGTDAPTSVTDLSVEVPVREVCRPASTNGNSAQIDIADNGTGSGYTAVSYQLPCGSSSVTRSGAPPRLVVPMATIGVFASADRRLTIAVGQAGRGILSLTWQCKPRLNLAHRFDLARPLAISQKGSFFYAGPAQVNGGRSVTMLHIAGHFTSDAKTAMGTISAPDCGKDSFSLGRATRALPPKLPQLPRP